MPRFTFVRASVLGSRAGLATVLALATVSAGLAIPDASATVAPRSVVTVQGFLTTPTSDPDLLTVNYTITVQGDPVDAASLRTATFADAPIDKSTVELDGSPVDPSTVTTAPSSMTVPLGSLGHASYLLSYAQRRPSHDGDNVTTSATLTFQRNGVTTSARSNQLALSHPDLSLSIPKGSGEDHAAYLGTGRIAAYGAYLKNAGATADDAILTIAFPTGVRLDYVDGVARLDLDNSSSGTIDNVNCANAATATVTCHLGAVAHGSQSVLVIPVVATRAGKAGTRGVFHVSVAPAGEPDQATKNNSLTGRVRFTGIARLHCKLIAKHTTVAVGSTVTVRLRIHNAGPQPAGFAYGLVASGKHFTIKKFITTRHPRHLRPVQRIPSPARFGSVIQWNTGVIGAHHTASARMVLVAKSVGRTRVEFYGGSAAGDPGCDSGMGSCHAITTLKLRAVKRATAAVKEN